MEEVGDMSRSVSNDTTLKNPEAHEELRACHGLLGKSGSERPLSEPSSEWPTNRTEVLSGSRPRFGSFGSTATVSVGVAQMISNTNANAPWQTPVFRQHSSTGLYGF